MDAKGANRAPIARRYCSVVAPCELNEVSPRFADADGKSYPAAPNACDLVDARRNNNHDQAGSRPAVRPIDKEDFMRTGSALLLGMAGFAQAARETRADSLSAEWSDRA